MVGACPMKIWYQLVFATYGDNVIMVIAWHEWSDQCAAQQNLDPKCADERREHHRRFTLENEAVVSLSNLIDNRRGIVCGNADKQFWKGASITYSKQIRRRSPPTSANDSSRSLRVIERNASFKTLNYCTNIHSSEFASRCGSPLSTQARRRSWIRI